MLNFIKKVGKKFAFFFSSANSLSEWEKVQGKYSKIPGLKGMKIRRKKYQSFFLHFGDNIEIHEDIYFSAPEKIYLGNNVKINRKCLIYGNGGIRIRDHCLVGPEVFIHSTNHDIRYSEKTFTEKSHIYKRVDIKENSLISARAVILPGAELGIGSFVSALALVSGKKYNDNTYLSGFPAKHNETLKGDQLLKFSPTFKIVFLVQNSHYERIAKILLSSLSMPQVGIIFEDAAFHSDAQVFILLGEATWSADFKQKNNLKLNDKKLYSSASGISIESNDLYSFQNKNKALNLPIKIEHTFPPAKDFSLKKHENILRLSLHYVLKFIKKSSLSTPDDFVYTLLLSFFVLPYDIQFCSELITTVFLRSKDLIGKADYFQKILDSPKTPEKILLIIKKTLLLYCKKTLSINCEIFVKSSMKYIGQDFSVEILDSLKNIKDSYNYNYLSARISKSKKSFDLAYYGIIAYFQNNIELAELAKMRLESEFFDEEICYIKSSLLSQGYCYSPLLPLFFLIMNKTENLESLFPILKKAIVNYRWEVLENHFLEDNVLSVNSFFDIKNSQYSESLLQNLEKALTLPDIKEGLQYEIGKDQHSALFISLQTVWREFLVKCIHDLGEACIIISPWPGNNKFALSLRYDVDRPFTQEQMLKILDIQKEFLGKPCATWYFFEDSEDDLKKHFLKSNFQELGLHAIKDQLDTDHLMDSGVTYHSGPNSSYWPGNKLLYCKNEKIKYYECLSLQMGRPILFFPEKENLERWLTPLHFPMEKGTQSKGEDPVLLHREKIEEIIKSNGHIILGSHPDVDQTHIFNFLKRMDIKRCWVTSVEEAVERCKRVLKFENFYIQYQAGQKFLVSKHSISGLQLNMIYPTGEEKILNLELNALQPRAIEEARYYKD